jgi:hypothetical protein
MWKVIKDGLGWTNIPKIVIDFNDNFLLEKGYMRNNLLFFLFGTVCWTLWLNRNYWVFRNKIDFLAESNYI